jgi:hypothetical protein
VEEKSNRAFCIAIAALVGDGVYNFGELVSLSLSLSVCCMCLSLSSCVKVSSKD